MNSLKHANQASRAAGIALAFVLLILAFAAIRAAVITQVLTAQTSRSLEVSDLYERVRVALTEEKALERKYRLLPAPETARAHRETGESVVDTLCKIEIVGSADDREIASQLLAAHQTYEASAILLFACVDNGATTLGEQLDTKQVVPSFQFMQSRSNLAAAQHHENAMKRLAALARTQETVKDNAPIVLTIGIALLALFWLLYNVLKERIDDEAREMLKASEERFRSLVRNTSDVIAIVGPDGHMRYVSAAAERVWGYPLDELEGRSISDFVHPDDKEIHLDARARTHAIRGANIYAEFRIKYRDGRYRVLDAVSTNLFGDPGVDGVLVTYRDVTERREAEAALQRAHDDQEQRVLERTAELAQTNLALLEEIREREQAQQELQQAEAQLIQSAKLASLGTLSAGVAHELNQPLAIIRGVTQQLLADRDLPENVIEDLDMVERHTSRMVKIINHMRTFCRSSGSDPTPISLNDVIQNCFILVGQQMKAHDVSVEWDLASSIEPVLADANELEQVFLNLIGNARDAMEGMNDKLIRIRSRCMVGLSIVEIADCGSGVPEEVLPRIFDPFFTTKAPGKGTGLGLSISYDIIAKHGGKLSVYNDGGAVFVVSIPTCAAEEDDLPTAA